MSTTVALLLALFLLIANGFFVAVEFGLIATQRAQLEDRANEGNRRARTALNAITNLNTQIAGAQLGITMASIALGLVAEPSVAHLLEDTVLSGLSDGPKHTIGLIIALSLVTFLHILIGEMVPKNIALADAPATAMWLSPLHTLFCRVTGPFVWLLNAMATGVLRLLGIKAVDERAQAKTPEELAMVLDEAREGDVLDGYEHTLLSNTLELGGASVAEAIVDWPNVDRTPARATVATIESRMADSGHSRIVLVDDDDAPVGWVHAKDLLALDADVFDDLLDDRHHRQFITVDRNSSAEDALEQMQIARAHFALAVDGATPIGIITIEDLLAWLVSGLADAGGQQEAEAASP